MHGNYAKLDVALFKTTANTTPNLRALIESMCMNN